MIELGIGILFAGLSILVYHALNQKDKNGVPHWRNSTVALSAFSHPKSQEQERLDAEKQEALYPRNPSTSTLDAKEKLNASRLRKT